MSETTLSEEQAKLTRRVPLAIWREVRRALCTLFDLFGEPHQIASRHTLTLKDHQLLSKWLRSVEALMRRMVFLEAALIAGALPASSQKAVVGKMPAVQRRTRIEHDPDHPEAWRVSFRVFHSSPVHGGSGSRAARDEGGDDTQPSNIEAHRPLSHAAHDSSPACGGARAPQFRSAWPLAERTEAVLRVFNNPLPYAQRLAARLRRAKTLVARLCEPWVEHRDIVTRSLFDALIEPLRHASAVFDTTRSCAPKICTAGFQPADVCRQDAGGTKTRA